MQFFLPVYILVIIGKRETAYENGIDRVCETKGNKMSCGEREVGEETDYEFFFTLL